MSHGDLRQVMAPVNARIVELTGVVKLGNGGAIGTGATDVDCIGFSLAKVGGEAGRYRATLHHKFRKLRYAHCVVEGAADAAAAAAKGQVAMLRNVDVANKTLDFQIVTPSLAAGASVDVEPEDGATLRFIIVLDAGKY